MEIVKRSNLGLIKSIFNSNTDNEQYYEIINNVFNGKVGGLEFAKPTIQTSAGYILWKANTSGPYFNYSELKDENQKLYLNDMVQKALKEIQEKLSLLNQTEDFLSKIIEIPSEESIFYTENGNAIQIILTEWGYTKDEFVQSQEILKKVFPSGLQSMLLKFKSRKGDFIEGIKCKIIRNNSNQFLDSDNRGFISLYGLKRGEEISIISLDKNFINTTITINEADELIITIERLHNLSFKVLNLNELPVENTSFIFVSDTIGKEEHTTNQQGKFSVKHIESDVSFSILDLAKNILLTEQVPKNDAEYIIYYDEPISQKEQLTETEIPLIKEELIEEEENYETNTNVTIELLNWRKKPIANHKLNLYGPNIEETTYETNEEGRFIVNRLKENREYTIFIEFKKSDWKKDFTHSDQTTNYSFIVKNKKFLWWWLPILLIFFFLISLIPTEVNHYYTAFDSNTLQPLSEVSINSFTTTTYAMNSLDGITNEEGQLKINYGKKPIYKQLFRNEKIQINAFKSGYQNITANIGLGYLKTNKSKLYLDPDGQNNDSIANCDSGGDADDAGGNSIKEYDLIKENTSFVFTYFTGDTHADIINIYNSRKEDINSSKKIWSYNNTTNDAENATINYSGRIITIEVIGGGNVNSVWEYFVNCP